MSSNKKDDYNLICTTLHISESEVVLVAEDYDFSWFNNEHANYTKLLNILYDLGMETDEYIEVQSHTQHRNRLNQVVSCARYSGKERLDKTWINSGYASRAAVDRASGSKFLEELYRIKGLTEDAQVAMEYKDKYIKVEGDE